MTYNPANGAPVTVTTALSSAFPGSWAVVCTSCRAVWAQPLTERSAACTAAQLNSGVDVQIPNRVRRGVCCTPDLVVAQLEEEQEGRPREPLLLTVARSGLCSAWMFAHAGRAAVHVVAAMSRHLVGLAVLVVVGAALGTGAIVSGVEAATWGRALLGAAGTVFVTTMLGATVAARLTSTGRTEKPCPLPSSVPSSPRSATARSRTRT